MPGGNSIIDAIMTQGGGEENSVVDALFDKSTKRLKMTTEIPPDLVYVMSVMGVIADRFSSKVLKMFASEFYQHEISKDRQGRVELVEALLAIRRETAGED